MPTLSVSDVKWSTLLTTAISVPCPILSLCLQYNRLSYTQSCEKASMDPKEIIDFFTDSGEEVDGWGEVDLILQPVHARNPLNISQRNEWAKIKVCSVVQVYQLHQSALSKVWKQVMTGQSMKEMNMCHQLISFDFSEQSISLFLHELNRSLHGLCTVELKGKAKSIRTILKFSCITQYGSV